VRNQVIRVAEWFDKKRIASFDITEDLVGGAADEALASHLHNETWRGAPISDAVLFGSVGGRRREMGDAPFALRAGGGVLRLRKERDLFANLQPRHRLRTRSSELDPEAGGYPGPRHHDHRELNGGRLFRRPQRVELLADERARHQNPVTPTRGESASPRRLRSSPARATASCARSRGQQ